MPGWTRVDTRTVLTVAWFSTPGDGSEGRCREIAAALDRHFAPVLPGCRTTWVQLVDQSSAVFLTAVGRQSPSTLPLVWGLAVGDDGEATDAELTALVEAPSPQRHLIGSFVLVAPVAGATRILSGADLMHVLTRVESSGGCAWSTKGWAALLATGQLARIDANRIPEYVVFDQVFGGDELLVGAATLPEAARIDLRPAGADEGSWWTAADRMRPGTATTGEDLRRCVVEELDRVGRVPQLHLGLTAGRDSTLVAVALAQAGAHAGTYTFGDPSWVDVRAARSTARALGLEHRIWAAPAPEPPSLARAEARTAWTEGLDTAANLVYPALVWDGPGDVVLLSGNGGETGRAFYYGRRPVPDDPGRVVGLLAGSFAAVLPPAAGDALRTRLQAAVETASDIAGGCGPRALDVLYATTRMRSWLARTVPPPHARATLAAFTSPGLTRVLLDLPDSERRDGGGFDVALGPDGRALRTVLPPDRAGWPDRLHEAVAARAARVRGTYRIARVTRRWTSSVDQQTAATLRRLFDEAGTGLAREVLGQQWWRTCWDNAPYDADTRRQLWNALAVDVLARRAPV